MLKISLTFFLVIFYTHLSLAKQRILIVGDSLTEAYGVTKKLGFPSQLQKLLNADAKGESYEVIAAGSAGATTAGAYSRLKWHLKRKPNIMILALGGNDGLRGLPLASTKKNLAKAIKLAQEQKIKVYLAGMQTPTNYGKKYGSEFKKLFSDLAKEKKVTLIPFILEGVGGEKELNLADGIHPNEKGHLKIAQTLFKILKR